MEASRIMMWVDVFAVVILMITMVEDIRQYHRNKKSSRYFLLFQGLIILMLVANIVHFYLELYVTGADGSPGTMMTLTDAILFIFYYAALFFFVCYVQEFIENKQRVKPIFRQLAAVICVLSVAIWVLRPVLERLILGGNPLTHGPAFGLGRIGGHLINILVLVMLWLYRKALSVSNILVLSMFVILPFFTAAIRPLLGVPGLVQLSMAIAMVALHVSIFREAEEKLRSQEVLLTRTRIRIMRSQIGPHFLFNTLNAIYVLCEKDPVRAQEAVSDFSEYLRVNIDTLENDARIPFTREISNVEHYLRLETIRFREDLQVRWELDATGFIVPALTVQPIVENAINHGIGRKKGGGTVTIRSEESEDHYLITVQDDGVGFDTTILSQDTGDEEEEEEWLPEQPGRKHLQIGLKNVRERLAFMSDATMTVNSRPGEGTTVIIRLPKEKNRMFKTEGSNENYRGRR